MDVNIPKTDQKRVVIIGGGFGGLMLANRLKKSNFQLVLLDKCNYHQFQPLLYQVATAGLEPGAIAFPFRKVFQRSKNFYYRLTEVTRIVPEENRVECTIGSLGYDYLVMALGTDTNYFGMENVIRNSMPMKSVAEAMALRNKLLQSLEQALITVDEEEVQALLNIVVVGGGATGVEVSGALAEMKRYVIPKDYPELASRNINIFLVEGSSKLLGNMSGQASEKSLVFLQRMGVNVLLDKRVVDYQGGRVMFMDGEGIPTRNLIWVSGVTANRIGGIKPEAYGKGGRVAVDDFNGVKGYENIYAIGDGCLQVGDRYPNGHPQVAQVAIQQGKRLAANLKLMVEKRSPVPFVYHDKGSMATVGRNRAVVDLRYFRFQGLLAWFVWMVVHLMSILGVKNRLEILLNWLWNYVTYDQSLRLILKMKEKPDSCEGK